MLAIGAIALCCEYLSRAHLEAQRVAGTRLNFVVVGATLGGDDEVIPQAVRTAAGVKNSVTVAGHPDAFVDRLEVVAKS